MKQIIVILSVFLVFGANAESFSNDGETKLEDALLSRFRILNTLMCGMCETVFKTVIQSIGENSSKDEILQAIGGGCTSIPDVGNRAKCQNVIKSSGDQIVALFDAHGHATTKAVCKLFQFC